MAVRGTAAPSSPTGRAVARPRRSRSGVSATPGPSATVTLPAAEGEPSGEGDGPLGSWRRHRPWLIRQALVWGLGLAFLRVVVVPGESCPPVDGAALQRGIDEGAAWLVRGQRDDGRYLYGYTAGSAEVSPAYNTTRHAGVVDVLYRLGRIGPADAGLGYVRRNLIHHDGWTAFAPAGGGRERGRQRAPRSSPSSTVGR